MSSPQDFQLPDECWEHIFNFLIHGGDNGGGDNHRYFESLSAVTKQFLSITNRLRFTLTITTPTIPFLPRLFNRFPNLTSLNLTRFSPETDLDALLFEISTFPLNLKSLKFKHQREIPINGLRILSQKFNLLKSLTFSKVEFFHTNDLVFISDCFPFLEELDLSNPEIIDFVVNFEFFTLPKLRKINLSGHYYMNDSLLFNLCKNCEFLEDIVMFGYSFITHDGIAIAIRERPGLRSLAFDKLSLRGSHNFFDDSLVSLKRLSCLDLSNSFISDQLLSSVAEKGLPLRKLVLQGCSNYSYDGIFNLLSKCRFLQFLDLRYANFLDDWDVIKLSSFLGDLVSINLNKCSRLTNLALFAFLRNCAKLSEVRMEYTGIGKKSVENSYTVMNFDVYPKLKALHFAYNVSLRDEDVNMFVSICPNLQLLDLRRCNGISEKGKIIDLNLAYCFRVKSLGMNFNTLEVLNLSESRIVDSSLYAISKICFGLLQLDLGYCYNITKDGVMQVIENCTQLREINLEGCRNVAADVVDSMVFMRLSLRKIVAPPRFHCSDSKRKLFLRHGCLVC